MATYLIGDVQGCYDELRALLRECGFNDREDLAIFLGDLVNRGPKSREVLQFVKGLGPSAITVLGNHDLHLLACAQGVRKPSRHDTIHDVLDAPDAPELMGWLRHQRLAYALPEHRLLCVHAGVLPQWTLESTLRYASELEQALQSPHYTDFLSGMYGNEPAAWRDTLTGPERLRVIVNALTRLRFCTAMQPDGTGGEMEFKIKDDADAAPPGYMPWFDVPERMTDSVRIAFGHWSTLGLRVNEQIIALDTGCVWGGKLSAIKLISSEYISNCEIYQQRCNGYQVPV